MNIKKIDHIVITTAHPKESIAFYQQLGFLIQDAGSHYELYAGDFKINLHILHQELHPHAKHIQPGSVDLCLEVLGNLNDWKDLLLEQQISIEEGIVTRYGAHGIMSSIYLRDPDENLIELCSYEEV